jgi:2-C-methyl-D-erythritol 4-phosphate cytidylyltransferase
MKKYAVIVAGGLGKRMGTDLPKQFLLLKDKPLLYYAINTFLKAFDDLQIILVLPGEHTDHGREIIDAWFDKSRVQITIGGETRFESVKKGLTLIKEESIVFVHDAVRCLVTDDLLKRCYESALETGNAVPALPSKETVRLVVNDGNKLLDRDDVMLIQTPQTFHSKILLPAFTIDYKEKFTDEANVVEAFGIKINLIEGEETNIKITKPIDLLVAEKILEEREQVLEVGTQREEVGSQKSEA